MAEPTSAGAGAAVSITGSMVVLLGPVLGPWVTVLLTAFIGSLWTLGRVETDSRKQAVFLLARIILTALVLTGGIAAIVVKYMAFAMDHVLPMTAFILAAIGDKFETLREAVVNRLRSMINGAAQ